jgi:hypothetical protein
MQIREQIPYAWRKVAKIFSQTSVKTWAPLDRPILTSRSEAESGDEKYFSRIRILHVLARGVTGDIDIAATRIERAENVAGLAGDGLGGRKGLRRGGARWAWGRLRFLRDRRRRRLGARAGDVGPWWFLAVEGATVLPCARSRKKRWWSLSLSQSGRRSLRT